MGLYTEGAPVILAAASRFVWEDYDHKRNREGKRGDISRAYSADTIAMKGTCKTFKHEGELYTVVTGIGFFSKGEPDHDVFSAAYRLVPLKLYQGVSHTYNELRGKFTYDSMRVKSGKDEYVMVGPEVFFKADASVVDSPASLFAFDPDGEPEPEEGGDVCEDCGCDPCECDYDDPAGDDLDAEPQDEPEAEEITFEEDPLQYELF